MNRSLRVGVAAAALTLLPALAASAHPSLNPNQIPAGEAIDADLVVPHGCSTGDGVVPGEGEGVPTVEFALQKTDGVTVEPGEAEGWEVSEDDDAWVWTAAGGATADPISFPVTVTVDGEAGDELDLAAFQLCDDGQSYRWTVDSPETPAVFLGVTEGEVDTAEMDMGDHGEGEMSEPDRASEEAHAEDEGHESDADHDEDGDHATDEEHGEEGDHESELTGEDRTAEAGATALAGEQADDEFGVGIIIAIVAVVLLLVSGLVAVARGKQAT